MDNRTWKAENLSLGFPFATDSEKYELIQDKVQTKHNQFIVNYKCGDMFRLIGSSSGQPLNHVVRYIK
jgi:hypothetical protein